MSKILRDIMDGPPLRPLDDVWDRPSHPVDRLTLDDLADPVEREEVVAYLPTPARMVGAINLDGKHLRPLRSRKARAFKKRMKGVMDHIFRKEKL